MTSKTDFSADEWHTLREAPHLVVLAVAAAGGSGLFGSLKEAIAPAGTLIEALKGNNQLLRELCDKEEIKSAVEAIKSSMESQAKAASDFAGVQAAFRQAATNQARAALELLKRKGSSDDVRAYQDFLMKLGDKVANAAKEGAFLGFGGERVSEHERTLLAELAQAVGAPPA
jgi:hypothetical protein